MRSIASFLVFVLPLASGFSVIPHGRTITKNGSKMVQPRRTQSVSLNVDMSDGVVQGVAAGILGLSLGIGALVIIEGLGERAKERGSGLSEGMATRIAGQLLEDVEVSSVSDLGSLTSQLEAALKEKGGANEEELEMTEEDKRRIEEEIDDGW